MAWSSQLDFAWQRGVSCQVGESSDESLRQLAKTKGEQTFRSMERSCGQNQPISLGAGTKPTPLGPISDTNATQLRLKL